MFLPTTVTVTFVARGRARLEHPLVWTEPAITLTVPSGFVSDGASIPAPFWPFIGHPFSGSLLPEAFLHDFEIDEWRAGRPTGSSREVHRRLWRAMRSRGVGRVRAGLIFAGVSLFGPHWTTTTEIRPVAR